MSLTSANAPRRATRRVNVRWLRAGELLAAAGVVCVVVAMFEPWYEGPSGNLDAWDTFGPGAVLQRSPVQSGDAIFVPQKGWFSRNGQVFLYGGVSLVTAVLARLIVK